MFLIAALAHIHWASGLKRLKSAFFRHWLPVFHVNIVRFELEVQVNDPSLLKSRRVSQNFITVQMCSTFSPSPIHARLPGVFDVQIKLQRPD